MVAWFGNSDWGLGLPLPAMMVLLAAGAELVGGLALIVGLATRLVVIPLMVTMLVAAGTSHLGQRLVCNRTGRSRYQHGKSIGHGGRSSRREKSGKQHTSG